jgi:hypothetical protein
MPDSTPAMRLVPPPDANANPATEAQPETPTPFEQLATEYSRHFTQPDIQALRIIACTSASHYLCPCDYAPTWLMLIGPSSSGKTAMLETLNKLPKLYRLNTLTPNTFLSGLKDKKNTKASDKNSLLTRLGPSIILTMKDFTSILSLRHENKSEIISQLREIHDGFYQKAVGTGPVPSWTGRLTLITCCTPAIDKDRMAFRTMGDRFIEIRWAGPDDRTACFAMAMRQTKPNYDLLQDLMANCVARHLTSPELDTENASTLSNFSSFVAWARTPINRTDDGHKVIEADTKESAMRLMQAIQSIAMSSAALDDSLAIRPLDIDTARRVSLDTIPVPRRILLSAFTRNGLDKNNTAYHRLSQFTEEKTVADLDTLGILESASMRLTELALDMGRRLFPQWTW